MHGRRRLGPAGVDRLVARASSRPRPSPQLSAAPNHERMPRPVLAIRTPGGSRDDRVGRGPQRLLGAERQRADRRPVQDVAPRRSNSEACSSQRRSAVMPTVKPSSITVHGGTGPVSRDVSRTVSPAHGALDPHRALLVVGLAADRVELVDR